jgi:hypothetical protein
MKYSFSQLMQEIFFAPQGVRARVYKHTPSERNEAGLENFSTVGGAVLADFFVNPPWRTQEYAFVVAPRNQAQNHLLQLRKESIL